MSTPQVTSTDDNDDKTSQGYIYCLTNESMPGMVKVGMTTKTPEERADGLYTTGVPTPFKIEFAKFVENPREAEKKIHCAIEDCDLGERVNNSREFFWVVPERVRPLFNLVPGEWWNDESVSSEKSTQRSNGPLANYFEDGCEIRHNISSKDHILTASFCTGSNTINVDDQNFQSLSSFAKYHYEIVCPERNPSANGWIECEVKIQDAQGEDIWVKANTLRKK